LGALTRFSSAMKSMASLHGDSWAPNPTKQVCRKTTTGYVEVLDVDVSFRRQ
jgi:hypothetical protein